MLGVELRQLAGFVAVVEEHSFSEAARRLGYSQSALSQQVATLERALGHRLLERRSGQRPLSLTPVGAAVLRHAEAIIARLRATAADIAAFENGASQLSIGAYQSVSARLMPEILRRFAASWPRVKVRFDETSDDATIFAQLERGQLDFAFVMLPLPEGPFESSEQLRDPYVFVVAADSPLARRARPPTLAEIGQHPLIGHTETTCQRRLEETLRSAGIEPNVVFRSDDNGTVQSLVAVGMGSALVPSLTVDRNDDRVTVIALADRIPPRIIGLAWHRDRYHSEAARAFVAEAADVARALASTL